MSQFVDGSNKGYVATSALADGVAVKLSSGNIVVATAATDKIIGITVGKVAAGETGTVRLRSATGTVKVKLGGTVAVGDRLTANGTGVLITTTTAANEVVAVAVEAGVSGDFIEAMPSLALYAIT
jgi:hypothetical protein